MPHGEWLNHINPFSSSSCNNFFNFWSSTDTILYEALETSVILRANSILNSISLFGTNLNYSFGNLLENSHIIKVDYKLGDISLDYLPPWLGTLCTLSLTFFKLSGCWSSCLVLDFHQMRILLFSNWNQTFFFL